MRDYNQLRNALEGFKNAYYDLVFAFEQDDDVNDFLTEPTIYQKMSECFAEVSFDELPISTWCQEIINYLDIEQKQLHR